MKEQKTMTSNVSRFQTVYEYSNLNKEIPIYKLFGIPRIPLFENKALIDMELSNRSYQCLMRNRCRTYHALFSKNIKEITGFKNLGKITLAEILNRCESIAIETRNSEKEKQITKCIQKSVPLYPIKNQEKLFEIASSIVLGIEYDVSDLDITDRIYVHRLECAYTIIGKDLCFFALKNPSKAKELCIGLSDYYKQKDVDPLRLLLSILVKNAISTELYILPFVKLLKVRTAVDLTTVFSDTDRFDDIPVVVEDYTNKHTAFENRQLLESLTGFIDLVATGVTKQLDKACKTAIFNERVPDIIQSRLKGISLNEIARKFGITRERIRQIELKAKTRFSLSIKRSKINCMRT